MKSRLLTLGLLLALSACGLPNNVVVLLPDENGHVGHVIVAADGKTAELTQPLAAVGTSAGAAPGAVFVAKQQTVQDTFGGALAATPRAPHIFIIDFKNDSTEVAPASRGTLSAAIRAALATKNADISIVGHADATGSDRINETLSLSRARAISAMLVSAGVPSSIIDISYHGANNPLIPRPRGVPEPANRRVEVTIR